MKDLPEILTSRLRVGPHRPGNADALVRWSCDPELHRASDDDPAPPSPEAVRATLARWLSEERDDVVHVALYLRETDVPIGFGDLGHVDLHHGRAMVGLVVGERSLWGRGIGREALEALLRLAFETLGLRRVGAQIYAFNERSLRLFEHAGFVREGVLRANVVKDGVAEDEVVLGLLRHDWLASATR